MHCVLTVAILHAHAVKMGRKDRAVHAPDGQFATVLTVAIQYLGKKLVPPLEIFRHDVSGKATVNQLPAISFEQRDSGMVTFKDEPLAVKREKSDG